MDTTEPKTSEVESAVIGKWSEPWNASANDINDIWPATTPNGTPVNNTYVLLKKAPADGGSAQFFAFVIWNGNQVGHVYRVHVGVEGANLRNITNGAIATRTSGAPSKTGGFAGNPEVEPVPIPRPQIDQEFGFSTTELANAKTNAQTIHNATIDFMNYTEQ